MSFVKAGYLPAQVGTTSVKIGVTEDGYIAGDSDTVAGTKTFTINRVAAENDYTANDDVINFFVGLVNGAKYNPASNTMQVKWTTDDDTIPKEEG